MIKKRSRLLAVVVSVFLIFLFSPFSSIASSEEKIISFHSAITVHRDASLTVKETIRVRAEGEKIKHGIYRDFPLRYRDLLGNLYVVGFNLKEVLKDGRAEPYHLENRSNGKRIYIGDKNTLLANGEYTYTLVYVTDHQLGFFRGYDELYWNVTGNDWEFPIAEASASVGLPGDASRHIVSFAGYTGPKGSKEEDFRETADGSGMLMFSATRPLEVGEGLTIAVSWPKGYVAEPTKKERISYFLSANPGTVIGPVGLLLLLFYYMIIWIKVGKDPDPGTIVTRYVPPGGMTPAVMRFITKMGYDQKAFASAVINMAVKGHLLIAQKDGVFTLRKNERGADPLSPEEGKVMQKLFDTGNEIVLEQTNHKKIRAAIDDLKNYLKLKYEKIYFVTNKGYFISGLVLSIVIIFLCGYRDAMAKEGLPIFLFMCVWLSGWSIGVTLLSVQVVTKWIEVIRVRDGRIPSIIGALFLTVFSLPFAAGEVLGLFMLGYATSALMVFFLISTVFINCLFYYLLKAPTRAGRGMLDVIDGFRVFLSATEKDRMNLLNSPAKTPELFEKYLPYALALGVEQQWAEQFSDILARAAAAGEERGYSPVWYSGAALGSESSGAFASSFGASLAGAISSSSSAPGSSSGSGGGGSSGGGGGGGGGGGW
jgi:uncharacterized membrane protein YgcG